MDRRKAQREIMELGFMKRPTKMKAVAHALAPLGYISGAMALAQASPIVLPLAAVLIASRYRYVANLVHWGSHYSACEDRGVNEVIFKFECAFLGWNPQDYRAQHLSHHKYLGDYDKDGDFGNHRDLDLGREVGLKTRANQIFSKRFWQVYAPKIGFRDKWQTFGSLVNAAVLGLTITSGWYYAGLVWLVGMFAIYPLIRFFSDLVDHGGIYGDTIKTRNCLIKNKVLRAILFPLGDFCHLLHHLFMGVPAQHQEAVHQYLMETDHDYSKLSHYAIDHIDNALGKRPLRNIFDE
jgi:fatty acid desaturase